MREDGDLKVQGRVIEDVSGGLHGDHLVIGEFSETGRTRMVCLQAGIVFPAATYPKEDPKERSQPRVSWHEGRGGQEEPEVVSGGCQGQHGRPMAGAGSKPKLRCQIDFELAKGYPAGDTYDATAQKI